jgi:hypothetical protein
MMILINLFFSPQSSIASMKEISIRRRSGELRGVGFPGLPCESLRAYKSRFEPRDKGAISNETQTNQR